MTETCMEVWLCGHTLSPSYTTLFSRKRYRLDWCGSRVNRKNEKKNESGKICWGEEEMEVVISRSGGTVRSFSVPTAA